MTGDVAFSVSQLLGPVGGLIGLAFGAGASAGWFFAERTVLKITRTQVADLKDESHRRDAECNRRIDSLHNQLNDLRERYTTGLERSIAQLRESGYRVLYEGHERREEVIPPRPPRKRP